MSEAIHHLSNWSDDAERILRAAVERYMNMVHYIMNYGEEYDDVLQYLRIQVWRRRVVYSERYCLSTFIFTVVKYELLRRIDYINRVCRSEWRHRVSLELELEEGGFSILDLVDPSQCIDSDILCDDMLSHVRRGLLKRFRSQDVDKFIDSLSGKCDCDMPRNKRCAMMKITRSLVHSYITEADHV